MTTKPKSLPAALFALIALLLPVLLGMPVEVTVLQVGDGTSKQEQEELEAQRTRMRTQLMSGSGPDLLDDPVKSIQYLAAAEQVDTARFCYLGSRALHGEVVFPVSRGERTLEQAAGDLAETYRYYFSE